MAQDVRRKITALHVWFANSFLDCSVRRGCNVGLVGEGCERMLHQYSTRTVPSDAVALGTVPVCGLKPGANAEPWSKGGEPGDCSGGDRLA